MSDEATIRKQIAEFVTSIIGIVDSIDGDLAKLDQYEDTLRERIERDIKADAYDKILEVVNKPLE